MKTHREILEETEQRLFNAMIDCDFKALKKIIDTDFIFTDETGKIFKGIKNQPIMDPKILCVKTVDIIERDIALFNNVAIVNSFERRTGDYLQIAFDNQYRLSRVWKFNGRSWMLIGATAWIL